MTAAGSLGVGCINVRRLSRQFNVRGLSRQFNVRRLSRQLGVGGQIT
jgi:hypothetical protein